MKISNGLILKQMELGPMQNFLYFIGDAKTNEIAVVDPAWDVDYLCKEAEKNNYKIRSILLTHGHPDHVNGIKGLLSRHNVPVYISKHELSVLKPRHQNLVEVSDRDKIQIGGVELECFLTPGHSPGCQCFYVSNILITGDALFVDGCGRCDLPGGDPRAMYRSLYEVIMKFPDDTIIFPGHNYGPVPYTKLSSQKTTNHYLKARSLDDFLISRMGMSF